jgi:hypothetical protein
MCCVYKSLTRRTRQPIPHLRPLALRDDGVLVRLAPLLQLLPDLHELPLAPGEAGKRINAVARRRRALVLLLLRRCCRRRRRRAAAAEPAPLLLLLLAAPLLFPPALLLLPRRRHCRRSCRRLALPLLDLLQPTQRLVVGVDGCSVLLELGQLLLLLLQLGQGLQAAGYLCVEGGVFGGVRVGVGVGVWREDFDGQTHS